MKQLQNRTPLFSDRHIYSAMAVVLLGLVATPAFPQLDELTIAKELAYTGNYEEADALFSLIIKNDINNLDARLGRAYNHSWHQNLGQARLEFDQILASDPSNKDALIGLGYTLAWAEEYSAAKHPFFRAQQYHPNDPQVQKGLAYIYLWQQTPEVARDMFAKLKEQDPENTEYYVALAYAHLQMYETREARRLLTHALAIDPGSRDAQLLRNSLKKATPLIEIDVWAGYSDVDNASNFGLRSLGLSIQATRKLRPFLLYDNTLSLDNLGFLQNAQSADTYYAGTLYAWNRRNTSRLQYGYRNFGTTDGSLVIAEHNHHFRGKVSGKVGGVISDNISATSAWMIYGGAHASLHPRWAIEPVYFLTRPAPGESLEHRISTTLQYNSRSGLEWNLGALIGTANATVEQKSESTYGFNTMLVAPVHRSLWLQGLLRYEQGVLGDFFVASGGIKIRIEK